MNATTTSPEKSPRVVYITAGGAGMFCGSCMRDNSLVAALRAMGSDVLLVPTFTPIRTDEEDVSVHRVFLGGINVYLEERWPIFRHLPHFLRRALDHPLLLRGVSKLALATRRDGDGALAASLLRGELGHQKAEIEDLVEWLSSELRPDLVNLTNLLVAGFVTALKPRLDVPVLVTLQGDDVFLDALPESDREEVIVEMRRVARSIDGFVVFSDFYRDEMAALLDIPPAKFHSVPLGLAEPEQFAAPTPTPSRPPTLGYLARICPEKGFHHLVDAFLLLKKMPGMEDARLKVGGWLGALDRPFFEAQQRKITDAGLGSVFQHTPDLPDRASKISFLHEIDVFSVPTVYRDPKGLFALEALAAGVPVVLPAHGAFPELVAQSGGARLVPPNDPEALAKELHALLTHPDERQRLGLEGQRRVCEGLSSEAAARATLEVWQRVIASSRAGIGP